MAAIIEKCDVLICGSGSAGIFAAAWLARYGIKCTVLEKRDGPLVMGQADGVQCRTVEIFESFGMSEELLREAYHVLEVAFWADDGRARGIVRTGRAADTEPGLSHLPHVILNQARINGLMLEAMKRWNEQEITYSTEVIDLKIDGSACADPKSYPITVTASRDGQNVTYQAKYAISSEGAHSQIRKSLGFQMVGDRTDAVWAVIDLYPRTNFPDIRKKTTIHSASGSLIIIPREGGSLARFYIELPEGTDPKSVQKDQIIKAARSIFAPYTMEEAHTHWWSCYAIGQRLIDNMHSNQRVFMAGDTAHSHSPKAGQGMNASLQDGYNIGWKLALILQGRAKPELINTYAQERGQTAKQLIDFDRYWTKLFKRKKEGQKEDPQEFNQAFVQAGRYTAGLTAKYEQSCIINVEDSEQELASKLTVGMRLPSTLVVRLCDVKSMQLVKAFPSDGRFRLLIFGGNLQEQSSKDRLQHLAAYLDSPGGPIKPYLRQGEDVDSFIEIILLLSGNRQAIEQDQLPACFWPTTGKYQMRDLHKIYVDDIGNDLSHGHAYSFYGVEEKTGAIAIIRPDQFFGIEDHALLRKFFSTWVLPAS